jgi:hypothetical protein
MIWQKGDIVITSVPAEKTPSGNQDDQGDSPKGVE